MAERHTTIDGDQIDASAMGLGLIKDANDNIQSDLDAAILEFSGNKITVKNGGIDTPQLALDSVDNTILDLAGIYDFSASGTIRVGTPVTANDATNKNYVDGLVQGLKNKFEVRATSIANITLSNTQTVDGVALLAGDKVLVQGQAIGTENGIYTVVDAGAWTRAADYYTGFAAAASFMFIQEGTVYSDAGYVCTNDSGTDVVGTDALTYVQFSSAGVIIAGIALDKTGNTLDVKFDGITVGINGTNQLEVPDFGINTLQLADESVTEGKLSVFNAPTVGYFLGFTANGLEYIDIDLTGIQDDDYISNEIPVGLIDNSNTVYTLANAPINAQAVSVFYNGTFQAQGAGLDYTIAGSTITFVKAPKLNRDLYVTYVKV